MLRKVDLRRRVQSHQPARPMPVEGMASGTLQFMPSVVAAARAALPKRPTLQLQEKLEMHPGCARSALLIVGLGLRSPAWAAEAQQQFPNRPVRVVAPFPPGGTADYLSRLLTEKVSQTWGQQAIVDNRSGAGGVIGTEIVAKANRDGYTLLMAAIGHAANPTMYEKLPYDTLRDFAPIVLIAD